MENQWITVETLTTFAGVVFAVTLISQFLKDLVDQVVKVPTRVLVLLLSWLMLLGRQYVMAGSFAPEVVFMDILNGFVVALASMGAHSFAKDNFQWK